MIVCHPQLHLGFRTMASLFGSRNMTVTRLGVLPVQRQIDHVAVVHFVGKLARYSEAMAVIY